MRKIYKFTILFVILLNLILLIGISRQVSVVSQFQLNDDDRIVPLDLSQIPAFWGNMSRFDDNSLDITVNKSTEITWKTDESEVQLNQTKLFYTSHFNGTEPVRIFTDITKPILPILDQSAIGLVAIHGIGGSHEDVLPITQQYASQGIVTVSIDLPGHGGQSTGISSATGENIVQIDPTESVMYHDIIAVYRAISLLSVQPEVNHSKIALTGGSFGAVMTFLTAALDDRIDVALPLIASGDWETSTLAGSFINLFTPADLNYDSPRLIAFTNNFDPLIYASNLPNDLPIFYAIGTKDTFFISDAANLTYSVIPGPKTLLFKPNLLHEVPEIFINTAYEWLTYQLDGISANQPPVIDVTVERLSGLFGESLFFSIDIQSVSPVASVEVAFHDRIIGLPWRSRLAINENSFYTTNLDSPIHGQSIEYLVLVKMESGTSYTTSITIVQLNNWLFIPASIIFLAIGMSPLIITAIQRYKLERKIRIIIPSSVQLQQTLTSVFVIIISLQMLMLFSVFGLFWITITVPQNGTLNWTLWQFIDYLFFLDGLIWLILLYLLFSSSLLLVKFRLGVFITPLLPLFLFLILMTFTGLSGIGFGLYLALASGLFQVGIVIVEQVIYRRQKSVAVD